MEVSRAAYNRWAAGLTWRGNTRREEFDAGVRKSFDDNRKAYGARRIAADLREGGVIASRRRVRGSMKRQGLVSTHEKLWRPATTDSRGTQRIAPNLLENGANRPETKGEVLVGDITYIRLRGGVFCYLAVFVDLLTKRVVGWSIRDHMKAELVTSALLKAIHGGHAGRGAVIHTDRGSQYGSNAYLEVIERHGLRASMSRKGNCWDNAWSESFFATLKKELVGDGVFDSMREAELEISAYVEGFYNRKRRHSSLGMISPMEFERRSAMSCAAATGRSAFRSGLKPRDGASGAETRSREASAVPVRTNPPVTAVLRAN
jgi:putative transposase